MPWRHRSAVSPSSPWSPSAGSIYRSLHRADQGEQKRVRELLDETRRKIYAILAEVG
jgi:DNA-binding PadR family transcriptional regulator